MSNKYINCMHHRSIAKWVLAAVFLVAVLLVTSIKTNKVQAVDNGVLFSPSGMAATSDGRYLLVCSDRDTQLLVWDVSQHKRVRTISTQLPAQGVCAGNGNTVYVAEGASDGVLSCYDRSSGKRLYSVLVGHTPTSPVVYNQGKKAVVCARFQNELVMVNLTTRKVTARIKCPREPIAVGVTSDGRYAVAVNHLPTQAATAKYVAASVSLVDLAKAKLVTNILLPNGSSGVRGAAVSPDGRYAYVTHIIGRFGIPTTQLDRGWMNTNALSIIDIANRKLVNSVLLDDVDRGAANPWAVAVSADGKYITVSSAGAQELTVIDRLALHKKLSDVASGKLKAEIVQSAAQVPDDLAFLNGIRTRTELAGVGPRSLCVIGDSVYVADTFSQQIESYRISTSSALGQWALVPNRTMSEARKGEMLFNDGRLCYQRWQSCSTCHPDSRADGLNWDNMNDGMGNPKNTRSMLYTFQTPPVMSLAVRDSAKTAVRAGIRYIQFSQRPESDAEAIDTYLTNMKPVKSPFLRHGRLSDAAVRGQKVFKQAGCDNCHSSTYYTNLKQYDVGTGVYREVGSKFDTSTLSEVWRTAPYLNDGGAADMMSVLTTHNKGDKHGRTSKLTKKQLSDLAEYVLSL